MAMIQTLVLTLLCLQASLALRVGNFPQSVYPNLYPAVLSSDLSADILARIIVRYDIITMPSITKPEHINNALKKLNCDYDFYMSNKMIMQGLGAAEQLVIAYRRDVVSLSDFIRYQPNGMMTTRVKIQSSGQEFVLAVAHLPGDYALELLQKIPSAYETVKSTYKLENVLFSGDFNTFSRFMNKSQADSLTVSRNDTFQWFINWEDNTFIPPVASGAAARFLTAGNTIKTWVTPGSSEVFNITSYFGMTLSEAAGLALILPVEIELKEPIKRLR